MRSFGDLPTYDPAHIAGAVPIHQGNGLVMGATVLVILRAFANGGSSLTGVEAISNTVNLFRRPAGLNARRVLTVMAWTLGLLLAGVAWLASLTHATPYLAGYPSMLSEIGRAVFGDGLLGNVLYFSLQAASAAILYNGANTSFNGFPALAHFVAEDGFLPRPLMKRGHRLVFSNAIVLLAVWRSRCCWRPAARSAHWFHCSRWGCSAHSRWPASGWPNTISPNVIAAGVAS